MCDNEQRIERRWRTLMDLISPVELKMNLASQPFGRQEKSVSWTRGIHYGLLLAALVLLPAGMSIAAVGGWIAIQGGSLIYLLAGLVIVLVALTIERLVLDEFSRTTPDYS